jgi:bifunctional non-homologous end joining protein LigD
LRRLLRFIVPQMPVSAKAPPEGPIWIHESVYNGYRCQAHIFPQKTQIFNDQGQDWTHRFPHIHEALRKAKVRNGILDGEVVWLGEDGKSDAVQLEKALQNNDLTSVLFLAFDLLYLNGEDLRLRPLSYRKSKLEKILTPLRGTAVLASEHCKGNPGQWVQNFTDHPPEKIISKRLDSSYLSGPNQSWIQSTLAKFTPGRSRSKA